MVSFIKKTVQIVQKIIASLSRNPLISVIVAILLVLAARRLWVSNGNYSDWLSSLAFLFALFTWFTVEAKQWPNMQVERLESAKQTFEIHSPDGGFALAVWFRFFNRSAEANTVTGSKYWLCIGDKKEWQPISHADIVPFKDWLDCCEKELPGASLRLPVVYPPHTADVRCVAFSAKVPWNCQGGEKPRIRLKVDFEMMKGYSETVEVDLKWQGNLPMEFPTHRP